MINHKRSFFKVIVTNWITSVNELETNKIGIFLAVVLNGIDSVKRKVATFRVSLFVPSLFSNKEKRMKNP
ncbi:hypothetical protein, partial [Streptococcus hyointestinalis]